MRDGRSQAISLCPAVFHAAERRHVPANCGEGSAQGRAYQGGRGDCANMVILSSLTSLVSFPSQVYLHPSRIPHSPQRFENTIGLVCHL